MIMASDKLNRELKERLERLAVCDRDYWSFKGNSRREHGHGFFQYPAMMVPQMVRAILAEVCAVHPEIEWVFDPFAGSGTILTESMLMGLSFAGCDINPLAILLCRTKTGPFLHKALADKVHSLLDRINRDMDSRIEVDFAGRDKWFRNDVQIALSKIRRAIMRETTIWARRFFWIALAETVRITSNSRTSTFKLHTRPSSEIATRTLDPIVQFQRVVERNLEHLKTQSEYLNSNGYLNRGHYTKNIELSLGDTRKLKFSDGKRFDIVITSPPYGDNVTTVPYGQYSYLPLQWIDPSDIDSSDITEYLRSTHEIDYRSLGGSQRISEDDTSFLSERSQSFGRLLKQLSPEPPDRVKKVTAFFRDLNRCLAPIFERLQAGGLMFWTLGNRCVAGKSIPLDAILTEMLEYEGAVLLTRLKRRIPSKRMAIRNNIAETMRAETILVMRKAM